MANSNEWVVVFYVDENGRSPVEEFLESLGTKSQKTPRREIEIALQRFGKFVMQQKKEK